MTRGTADQILKDYAESCKARADKGGGGAPAGNKFASKLKDSALKEEAYKQYCAHIAQGKSKESWFISHPELEITFETMEKYIAENPKDFPPIKKRVAECSSLAIWEQIIMDSAKGVNKQANTATLQMVMRNKFGWDKETRVINSVEPDVKKFFKSLDAIKV